MVKRTSFFGGFLIVLCVGVLAGAAEKPAQESDVSGDPFAVVELFTSEGCSSCPPADGLLAKILESARKDKERLFPLSFHVDYWNQLGWTDSFSDPAYSKRQSRYTQALKVKSNYTPQMVVNGKEQFAGSNWWRARQVLTRAMKTPALASLKLHLEKGPAADAVLVNYEVAPAAKDAVVNIALVERGLVSRVLKGENAGRTLRHENVVRVFKTVPLSAEGKGQVNLQIPSFVARDKVAVIVFFQNPVTMRILAANGEDLGLK